MTRKVLGIAGARGGNYGYAHTFLLFFYFFNLTRKVLGVAGARGGNDGYANTFLHMRNENSIIPVMKKNRVKKKRTVSYLAFNCVSKEA